MFVQILPRHRSVGIPRYMHGHHAMPMTSFVQKYNKQGFYTVTQVAKRLGLGSTTIRRYEGVDFPKAEKLGRNRARLFTEEQIQIIKNWRNSKWPNLKKFKNQEI
ncbi:MAG: MerR family transcriptional regulator [Candidatus Omnitrophica bacterium]|nr:MerR family transcriptional regulator [Candidatus Omnitrophota bacterium]